MNFHVMGFRKIHLQLDAVRCCAMFFISQLKTASGVEMKKLTKLGATDLEVTRHGFGAARIGDGVP